MSWQKAFFMPNEKEDKRAVRDATERPPTIIAL